MIISDKHQFVFIHIPKCAGSYVRKIIKDVDDTSFSANFVKTHPTLGKTDYTHIPLTILEKHFPEDYKKIQDFFSFCIIRDPHERFPSSLAQHIKMYKKIKLIDLSRKQYKNQVETIIDSLEKQKDNIVLRYNLIHFQKQVSYIFNSENQIVKNIYTTDNIESLFADLSVKTNLNMPANSLHTVKKTNNSKVFRNNKLGYLFMLIKPYSAMILKHSPLTFNGKVSDYMYLKPHDKFNDILSSNYIKDFIGDYYREDINFYETTNDKISLGNI